MSENRREDYAQTLAELDRFARWTDTRFRIPFTRVEFGLEPLLGLLLPGVGDLAGLLLATHVLMQARRVGAPPVIQRRMLRNILIDAVGGLVPLIGDLFDIYYKANSRNTRLLRDWLNSQLAPEHEPGGPLWLWLGLFLLMLALVIYVLSSSVPLPFSG